MDFGLTHSRISSLAARTMAKHSHNQYKLTGDYQNHMSPQISLQKQLQRYANKHTIYFMLDLFFHKNAVTDEYNSFLQL
jgi:hypothetical protein